MRSELIRATIIETNSNSEKNLYYGETQIGLGSRSSSYEERHSAPPEYSHRTEPPYHQRPIEQLHYMNYWQLQGHQKRITEYQYARHVLDTSRVGHKKMTPNAHFGASSTGATDKNDTPTNTVAHPTVYNPIRTPVSEKMNKIIPTTKRNTDSHPPPTYEDSVTPTNVLGFADVMRSALFTREEKEAFSEAVNYFQLKSVITLENGNQPGEDIKNSSVAEWLEHVVRQITVSARKMTTFLALPELDQIILLKQTMAHVMFVRTLYYYDNEQDTIRWFFHCVSLAFFLTTSSNLT